MSYEALLFWVLALSCVASSLMVLFTKRIVHCAFWLLGCFACFAGFYLMLGADFIAFTQVMVYIGGILILLLFGVMLTDTSPILVVKGRREAFLPFGIVSGLIVLGGTLYVFLTTRWFADMQPLEPTTEGIGEALMTRFLLPFEVASVLLLVALVGAAYLARRKDAE